MKKLLAIVGLAVATLLPATSHAIPLLYLTPVQQDVAVGDTVTVGVSISGFKADGEIVSALDLNVLFNSSILSSAGTVSFVSQTQFGGADGVMDAAYDPGNRGVVIYSLLTSDDDLSTLQTDDPFLLFNLTFTATADGVTQLNFGPDLFFQRNVVGRDGESLRLDYAGACVAVGTASGGCDVTLVPEPSSYALVLMGLCAIGAAARGRKRG